MFQKLALKGNIYIFVMEYVRDARSWDMCLLVTVEIMLGTGFNSKNVFNVLWIKLKIDQHIFFFRNQASTEVKQTSNNTVSPPISNRSGHVFVKDDVLNFNPTKVGSTTELKFRLCNDSNEIQKVKKGF